MSSSTTGGRRTYRQKIVPSTYSADEEDDQQTLTSSASGGGGWCVKRSGWFYGLVGGIVLLFHAAVIAALVVGSLGFMYANYSLTQSTHYQSRRLEAHPLAHVIAGTTPVVLTLPNDLSPYVGKLYHVDCASAASHTVVIEPGSAATWTVGVPNIRTATCLAAGGGFSFRVISSTGIRLIDPQSVSFT